MGQIVGKCKKIYEDILKSNNRFYSTLALNNIIEKNLENNDDKILEYFDTIEKLQKNKEQKDILKFKKALFLLKKLKNHDSRIYDIAMNDLEVFFTDESNIFPHDRSWTNYKKFKLK